VNCAPCTQVNKLVNISYTWHHEWLLAQCIQSEYMTKINYFLTGLYNPALLDFQWSRFMEHSDSVFYLLVVYILEDG
jgi:hypothetical protein